MEKKKTISFAIPCYNEVNNVALLAQKIVDLFDNSLSNYNYQIQFIDNCSTDGTRDVLRRLCAENKRIRVILNARNFPMGSAFHGILATTGDCTIYMAADLQDPVEMIPVFVKKWEEGFCIVAGINEGKKENIVMRFFRNSYYRILDSLSSYEGNRYILHFNGFGLYDKSFIDFIRDLDDPYPFLRTYVSEFGYKIAEVPFKRESRHSGKSKLRIYDLYALTMRSIANSTKFLIRAFTFVGVLAGIWSVMSTLVYVIIAIFRCVQFNVNTFLLFALTIMSSFITVFIGIVGEYVLNINTRVMKRPLVIEEERINFFDEKA